MIIAQILLHFNDFIHENAKDVLSFWEKQKDNTNKPKTVSVLIFCVLWLHIGFR